MMWTVCNIRKEAMDEYGYRITWAMNSHGLYFNAWSPAGAHIDSGTDREILKAQCIIHREKLAARLAKQREEYSKETA